VSTPHLLLLAPPGPAARRLAEALARAGEPVQLSGTADELAALLSPSEASILFLDLALVSSELEADLSGAGPPRALVLLDDPLDERAERSPLAARAVSRLLQPVADAEVRQALHQAREQLDLARENARLRQALSSQQELGPLVSRDARMLRIFETVDAIAETRATILIEGESGTGKTVLARAIHDRSSRAPRPFVVVNCGALPESLLASELFGHARGSFTGATRDRPGKFEAADGGTIFLDEIASASLDLQVKLLKVIEEGRFERVGEEKTRAVDARVIAASNVDLKGLVEERRFRSDLFWRLHVITIKIPSLRERGTDIPLLAARFLARFAAEHARPVRSIAPEALAALVRSPWPGNVRELENTIERGILLARGSILSSADLWPGEPSAAETGAAPPPDLGAVSDGGLRRALEAPERWLILRALEACAGSRQEAARRLGINRTTLFNKMRKYRLLDFPTKLGATDASPPPQGLPRAS
jgi:DNA-binding NtrC family response regulator